MSEGRVASSAKKCGRSCAVKIQYQSEQEAKGEAERMYEKGRDLRAYRCPACGMYHLTSEGTRQEILQRLDP